MQPVLRESRMVRNPVVENEPAEPPIGQMQLDFLGQLALRTQAVAVADNQHPHHQLGINRGPADLAVIGLQLLAHIAKHRRRKDIDASEQVLLRNAIFEPKLIEQTRLIASLLPHHRRLQKAEPLEPAESLFVDVLKPFSTASTPFDHRQRGDTSAARGETDISR